MERHRGIELGLAKVFEGIEMLKAAHPAKKFTIDGRLVGDIGEIVATLYYDMELYPTSQPGYDGVTSCGRKVQVKATFQDQLTFRTLPDYYLGIKLFADGSHKEIFNGPGKIISDHFSHRAGIGVKLLGFSIKTLERLSQDIPEHDRIRKR